MRHYRMEKILQDTRGKQILEVPVKMIGGLLSWLGKIGGGLIRKCIGEKNNVLDHLHLKQANMKIMFIL